jgi:predicted amidohydrolase
MTNGPLNPKLARHYEGAPATLRVALCQVHTEDWAIDANVKRTMEALEEAAEQGAELAITPECVVHGYGYADLKADFFPARMLEIAEHLDGPNITAFREKARALGMDVVLGFAERGEGEKIHNSAALISGDGEILTVYRKVHCRPFESIEHTGVFTPGEQFSVAERRYGDRTFGIGIMICFDREIPESVRCLRALGAEFIACPLATTAFDMDKYIDYADNEMITRARAAENELYIAVVNHAGRDMQGHSFIVGPGGERVCQMGTEPGVLVTDVPVGVVADKFHADPLGWMGWAHRRPDVYRAYLEPSDE